MAKKFIWADKKQKDYLVNGLLRHLHRAHLSVIVSTVLRTFKNRDGRLTCLDLGCGDGIYPKALRESTGINFFCCDADHARLMRARDYCGETGRLVGAIAEAGPCGRISRFLHPTLYKNSEHVHYYSERSAVDLLKNAGFDVVAVNRIGFLFPVYLAHMLLISVKFSFDAGNKLTRLFKFTADSLTIIARQT